MPDEKTPFELKLELSNYTILQTKSNMNKFLRHDLTIAWYPRGFANEPDAIYSIHIKGCLFRRNEKTGDFEWVGPHVRHGIRSRYFEVVVTSPAIRQAILTEIMAQSWSAQIGASWTPITKQELDVPNIQITLNA